MNGKFSKKWLNSAKYFRKHVQCSREFAQEVSGAPTEGMPRAAVGIADVWTGTGGEAPQANAGSGHIRNRVGKHYSPPDPILYYGDLYGEIRTLSTRVKYNTTLVTCDRFSTLPASAMSLPNLTRGDFQGPLLRP